MLRESHSRTKNLHIRGILHPRTADMERRLPRLVALTQRPAAEGTDLLPEQCGNVAAAG